MAKRYYTPRRRPSRGRRFTRSYGSRRNFRSGRRRGYRTRALRRTYITRGYRR